MLQIYYFLIQRLGLYSRKCNCDQHKFFHIDDPSCINVMLLKGNTHTHNITLFRYTCLFYGTDIISRNIPRYTPHSTEYSIILRAILSIPLNNRVYLNNVINWRAQSLCSPFQFYLAWKLVCANIFSKKHLSTLLFSTN